jgi:hypothetical protein
MALFNTGCCGSIIVSIQIKKNRAMEKSNFKDTIHSENPVLVDFFANLVWSLPLTLFYSK